MKLLRLLVPCVLLTVPGRPVQAEQGLQGNYIGIGVDGTKAADTLPMLLGSPSQNWVLDEALRQNRDGNRSTTLGSRFQGRFDLPNSPLSVRGSVFVNQQTSAVLPMLTYDVPIGSGTNVYAGAGYALIKNAAETGTPIGTQNGVVLTTGIEAKAGGNLVIYGDAKLNLSDRQRDASAPVRFQFGAGLRF